MFMLGACSSMKKPSSVFQDLPPYPQPPLAKSSEPFDSPIIDKYPEPDDTIVFIEEGGSISHPSVGESPPSPWLPSPEDNSLQRGDVFIDEQDILILESMPPQFMLHLRGSLPTPCHKLRVDASEPDEQNRIIVEVYSLTKPGEICIQVLDDFAVNVPLKAKTPGQYIVWVNAVQVGGFLMP